MLAIATVCAWCGKPAYDDQAQYCECGHRLNCERRLCDCAECMRRLDLPVPELATLGTSSLPPFPRVLALAESRWQVKFSSEGSDRLDQSCRAELHRAGVDRTLCLSEWSSTAAIEERVGLAFRLAWSAAGLPWPCEFLIERAGVYRLVKFAQAPDGRPDRRALTELCTSHFVSPRFIDLAPRDAQLLLSRTEVTQ